MIAYNRIESTIQIKQTLHIIEKPRSFFFF